MDTETLATEMLKELKANNERSEKREKRWFTLAMIELVIIVVITGMFIWYINQPIEETIETTEYTQDANTGDNSSITQSIGEQYGKSKTNKESCKKNHQKKSKKGYQKSQEMNYDFTKFELDYINKNANFNDTQQEIFNRLTDKRGRQSIVQISMEMNISTATVSRVIKQIKHKILKII